jgi:hypothetical protein
MRPLGRIVLPAIALPLIVSGCACPTATNVYIPFDGTFMILALVRRWHPDRHREEVRRDRRGRGGRQWRQRTTEHGPGRLRFLAGLGLVAGPGDP